MFNFLASKHRQPPEFRPQEDEDDEGQLRTARSVLWMLYLPIWRREVGLFLNRKCFLVTFPSRAAVAGAPPWSCRWL